MTSVDAAMLFALALLGTGGYAMGFVAHLPMWVGSALGLVLGLWAIEPLATVTGAAPSTAAPLAVSLAIFGSLAGAALGFLVGTMLHVHVADEHRTIDRAAGAAVGIVATLVSAWLLLPVVAAGGDGPRQQVEGSMTDRALDSLLPDAPDLAAVLTTLSGGGLPPSVVGVDGSLDIGEPPTRIPLDDEMHRDLELMTVRVEGVACGERRVGSGMAIDNGVVVTNAHVVAGSDPGTLVVSQHGVRLAATLVHWDPSADVAVLLAPGMQAPLVSVASAQRGDLVAVAGHPGGGAQVVIAGRVEHVVQAHGRDILDQRDVTRRVLVLAATIEGGISGGPVLRDDGALVGMVFAHSSADAGVGYALDLADVRNALAAHGRQPVASGPCVEL